MITVKDLIKLLKTCDPKANVCLASDTEGNHMRNFYELEYDDENIYLIPVEQDNEYYEEERNKIRREIFSKFSK